MATAASPSGNIGHPLPVLSFIRSQKGKPLLVSDGHVFKLNKTTTTTKYWKCAVNDCSAKIHTDLNDKLINCTSWNLRSGNTR